LAVLHHCGYININEVKINIRMMCIFSLLCKKTYSLKEKNIEINLKIQAHKLKSLCETRWVYEVIMIFKEFLHALVIALEQIENDSKNIETI